MKAVIGYGKEVSYDDFLKILSTVDGTGKNLSDVFPDISIYSIAGTGKDRHIILAKGSECEVNEGDISNFNFAAGQLYKMDPFLRVHAWENSLIESCKSIGIEYNVMYKFLFFMIED